MHGLVRIPPVQHAGRASLPYLDVGDGASIRAEIKRIITGAGYPISRIDRTKTDRLLLQILYGCLLECMMAIGGSHSQ